MSAVEKVPKDDIQTASRRRCDTGVGDASSHERSASGASQSSTNGECRIALKNTKPDRLI